MKNPGTESTGARLGALANSGPSRGGVHTGFGYAIIDDLSMHKRNGFGWLAGNRLIVE
jgi:hypothetical protein